MAVLGFGFWCSSNLIKKLNQAYYQMLKYGIKKASG